MFYSPKADELRVFLRDKLDLDFTDTGGGWLIFKSPEAEIGCHPSDRQYHELSFYCDDIDKTVTELTERGVEFTSGIRDEEWGRATRFLLPDGAEVELYQPKYTL